MKKIDKSIRANMMNDLNSLKPTEVMKKYNISKATLYNIKKAEQNEQPERPNNSPTLEEPENKEISNKIDEMEVNINQYYDPENIRDYLHKQNEESKQEKHMTIPKRLIDESIKTIREKKGIKTKSKLNDIVKYDEPDDDPKEKKELIIKIRQYVFAFEDNKHIARYVGKNKDRFVMDLNKKSINELNDFISNLSESI